MFFAQPVWKLLIIGLTGLAWSEFAGYWYHRIFQHAIIRISKQISENDKTPRTFHFIPWKTAFYIHMWHHYMLYPEPNAPGTKPKPFRPSHVFYTGNDIPEDPFRPTRSGYNPTTALERARRSLAIIYAIDWFLPIIFLAVLPPLFIFSYSIEVVAFLLGGALAAFLNKYVHDSFHVLPYPKLRNVPWSHWLQPAVFFANIGEHIPGFRSYYHHLLVRHLAHHYEVERMDDANVRYRGIPINAQISNFTIYNPLFDILFGTESAKVFAEQR